MNEHRQQAYRDWVMANVKGTGYGKCQEIVLAMAIHFPELRARKGVFMSLVWGDRPHWWCADEGNRIVDPTSKQHPDGQMFPGSNEQYIDLTDMPEDEAIDRGVIPTGKCPNCGDMIYKRRDGICSDDCSREYAAYLNGGKP